VDLGQEQAWEAVAVIGPCGAGIRIVQEAGRFGLPSRQNCKARGQFAVGRGPLIPADQRERRQARDGYIAAILHAVAKEPSSCGRRTSNQPDPMQRWLPRDELRFVLVSGLSGLSTAGAALVRPSRAALPCVRNVGDSARRVVHGSFSVRRPFGDGLVILFQHSLYLAANCSLRIRHPSSDASFRADGPDVLKMSAFV